MAVSFMLISEDVLTEDRSRTRNDVGAAEVMSFNGSLSSTAVALPARLQPGYQQVQLFANWRREGHKDTRSHGGGPVALDSKR